MVKLGYNPKEFLIPKPIPRIKLLGKEKNCFFLDDENFCIIEKEHGHRAKPHTCIHYPDIDTEKIKEREKKEDKRADLDMMIDDVDYASRSVLEKVNLAYYKS